MGMGTEAGRQVVCHLTKSQIFNPSSSTLVHTALFWQNKLIGWGPVRESREAFLQDNEGALPSESGSPEVGNKQPRGRYIRKQGAGLTLKSTGQAPGWQLTWI